MKACNSISQRKALATAPEICVEKNSVSWRTPWFSLQACVSDHRRGTEPPCDHNAAAAADTSGNVIPSVMNCLSGRGDLPLQHDWDVIHSGNEQVGCVETCLCNPTGRSFTLAVSRLGARGSELARKVCEQHLALRAPLVTGRQRTSQ